MGVRLAAAALKQEHTPSLLAALGCKPQQGVDGYWDRHVRTRTRAVMEQWLRPLDCAVWLTPHHTDLSISGMLSKKRNILVYSWQQEEQPFYFECFDQVITPSQDAERAIDAFRQADWPRTTCIPWDLGTPEVRSFPRTSESVTRVYVPVDPYTLDKAGTMVVYVLNRILERHRHVRVALATFKSLPRHLVSSFETLAKAGKVNWYRRPDYQRQLALLQASDMTWVPSLRSDAGWLSLQSIEAGIPVVAFDVPPGHEFLRQGVNARLVECDLCHNGVGAPEAVADVGCVLQHLDHVLEHPHLLRDIWRTKENRSVRRSNFHTRWEQVWSNHGGAEDSPDP